MKKAVFLDRDGVINDNKKHVNKPEDLVIYQQAKTGMKKLYDAGYDIFVVTNQGGVELGHVSKEALDKIHDRMKKELEPYCQIKAIKYCPDFRKKSDCRKPEHGMLLELAEEFEVDLKKSWMVGDMDTDVEAGLKANCKTGKIGNKNKNANVNGMDLNEIAEKILKYDS